jgi:hypothetical protein
LALYLWADVKAGGSQTTIDRLLVNELRLKEPESPFYEALYQRWHKKEYDRAINLLYSNKTCDQFWGSCPYEAYVALTVAVMEGR